MKKEDIKIIILKYLQTTNEHPTINEIYNEINKFKLIDESKFNNVLLELENNEQISSIPSTDNKKHYEIKQHKHYHFMCNYCGMVRDIFIHKGGLQMLTDHAQKSINSFGKITKVNLSFQGTCYKCKVKNGKTTIT